MHIIDHSRNGDMGDLLHPAKPDPEFGDRYAPRAQTQRSDVITGADKPGIPGIDTDRLFDIDGAVDPYRDTRPETLAGEFADRIKKVIPTMQ